MSELDSRLARYRDYLPDTTEADARRTARHVLAATHATAHTRRRPAPRDVAIAGGLLAVAALATTLFLRSDRADRHATGAISAPTFGQACTYTVRPQDGEPLQQATDRALRVLDARAKYQLWTQYAIRQTAPGTIELRVQERTCAASTDMTFTTRVRLAVLFGEPSVSIANLETALRKLPSLGKPPTYLVLHRSSGNGRLHLGVASPTKSGAQQAWNTAGGRGRILTVPGGYTIVSRAGVNPYHPLTRFWIVPQTATVASSYDILGVRTVAGGVQLELSSTSTARIAGVQADLTKGVPRFVLIDADDVNLGRFRPVTVAPSGSTLTVRLRGVATGQYLGGAFPAVLSEFSSAGVHKPLPFGSPDPFTAGHTTTDVPPWMDNNVDKAVRIADHREILRGTVNGRTWRVVGAYTTHNHGGLYTVWIEQYRGRRRILGDLRRIDPGGRPSIAISPELPIDDPPFPPVVGRLGVAAARVEVRGTLRDPNRLVAIPTLFNDGWFLGVPPDGFVPRQVVAFDDRGRVVAERSTNRRLFPWSAVLDSR